MDKYAGIEKTLKSYYHELTRAFYPWQTWAFKRNSYAKTACVDILKKLQAVPWKLTDQEVLEFLNDYVEQMNEFATLVKQKNDPDYFVIAAETAEYLLEEYWRI